MDKRHQVVIVGGGPVGVALAVDLGLRGISCALVEIPHGPVAHPEGSEPHPAHAGAFLLLGHRRGIARRPADAERPPDRRGHLLWQHDRARIGTCRRAGRSCATTISRPTTACRNTRWKWCCGRRWRACRASRRASAGPQRRSSRTPRASASPWPRKAAPGARFSKATIVVGCDGGHSIVRNQIGIERGGTDFDQLMVLIVFRSRELHEFLKRFPERSTFRVHAPGTEGLLAVLRPHRCRRRLLLSRAGARRHHARQFRFQGAAAPGRRLRLRLRARPCRLLGSAGRGRGEISGRTRVHCRRRRAQPPALWRLRP